MLYIKFGEKWLKVLLDPSPHWENPICCNIDITCTTYNTHYIVYCVRLTDCFRTDGRTSHLGPELRMSTGSTFFCCALWTRGWPTVRLWPLCIHRTRTHTVSCGCSGVVLDTNCRHPTMGKTCSSTVSQNSSYYLFLWVSSTSPSYPPALSSLPSK